MHASLLLAGCLEPEPMFKDVCAHASDTVERCGATLPTLADSPCTGIEETLSQCIVDHAASCDDLATLMRHPDECAPDAGDDFTPDETDLPVPSPHPLDGGTDAGH